MSALRDVAPRLSEDAIVVLLPNGMGPYDEIRVGGWAGGGVGLRRAKEEGIAG